MGSARSVPMRVAGFAPSLVVGIVPRQFEFFAGLPPTMLTTNHARHDAGGHASADFDGAAGTFYQHPLLVRDAETRRTIGMNIRRRFRCRFAQARERALLAMNESREFGVGQHQRVFRGEIRTT